MCKKIYFMFLIFIGVVLCPFVVLSQETVIGSLNPEYLLYCTERDSGVFITQTEEGLGLGFIPAPIKIDFDSLDKKRIFPLKSSIALPAKYDLRTEGFLTGVKDQGGGANGGNCWTFTTMGAIESQWLKMGLGSYDLSEQSLATCHGFDWGYGEGGNDMLAMAYLTRLEGPVLESQNPYITDDTLAWCCPKHIAPVVLVPEVRWLPKDKDIIKQVIYNYGGISASMCWNSKSYQAANYTFFYSGFKSVNHAIMLVGWDDNYPTPAGKGAWICRNQWNTTWGENGYFYISYDDTKINTTASFYPVRVSANAISKIYYYDTLSAVNLTGFRTNTGFGLTRFRANGSELISMVGTFVPAASSMISVEVYDDMTADSLYNLRASLHNHFCSLPGYYTFDVNAPVIDDFFVKVKYYIPGKETPIPIEKTEKEFAIPHIETAGGLLSPQISWSFATTGPRIKKTYPFTNMTDVPLMADIIITFKEKCDTQSTAGILLEQTLFDTVFKKADTVIVGIDTSYVRLYDTLQTVDTIAILDQLWDVGKNELVLRHAKFSNSSNFYAKVQVVVPADVVRDVNNTPNNPLQWTFRLAASNTPPVVIYPQPSLPAISGDSVLVLEFSDKISIENIDKIELKDASAANINGFAVSLDTSERILTIKHGSIKPNTKYTLTLLDSAVKSGSSGLFNTTYSYTFDVLLSPELTATFYPQKNTTLVPLGTKQFFIKMNQDCDSINMSNITARIWRNNTTLALKGIDIRWDAAENTIIVIIKDGNCLTTRKPAKLKYNDTYYIVVPAGSVANKAGVTNKTFYSAYLPQEPFVYAYSPAPLTTMAYLDSSLVVTFDADMEAVNLNGVTIVDENNVPVSSVVATLINPRTLKISHDAFLNAKNYSVTIPAGALRSRGVNWISSDEKAWIPVGKGSDGYEYDLCIRAYAADITKPVALFECDRKEVCLGSPVTFINKSQGAITGTRWHFGEGASPATATNKDTVVVKYSTEGLKTISLIIETAGGNDTIIKYSYVHVTSVLNVIIPDVSIEIPKGLSDTLRAFGADEYYWMPTYYLNTAVGPSVEVRGQVLGTFVYHVYGKQGNCWGHDSVTVLITQRPANDNVCDALLVPYGITGPYTNKNATVEQGEPSPPNTDCNTQQTWCYEYNSPILKNSVWFKFIAPASGKVSIATNDKSGTLEMDSQIALYDADSCLDILHGNCTLIAANDDFFDEKDHFAAAIQLISSLVPGRTYWIQLDGSAGGEEGSFYLTLSEYPVEIKNVLGDNERLIVYPVPASDIISILIVNQKPEKAMLTITTASGQQVYHHSLSLSSGSTQQSIDIKNFPSGTYVMILVADSFVAKRVFIKQ